MEPREAETPIGIGTALAENMPAMYRFAQLDEQTRERFIHEAQALDSPQELRAYVNRLLQQES